MCAITPVNLDYAASTPLRESAKAAQRAYDASDLAGVNPNSLHSLGRRAQAELERCRRVIAASFGARVRASEVVFTGGGTEANHLAVHGLAQAARQRDPKRTRVLVSAIEHDSVLDNALSLKSQGFTVQTLLPNRQGVVEPATLQAALGDDVALVSVMLANNETGVVQPIAELAGLAHRAGARMHTDAVQGWLHIPFDVAALGVDALSVAGHKIGGPVGVGALYLKGRVPLRAQIVGGGQERGLRAGTQDLRTIAGFAAAVQELAPRVAQDRDRLTSLSNSLYSKLTALPDVFPTMGDPAKVDRLPGIVSVYVDGMDSEELILQLDVAGFEVSAASACSSGSMDPSHVLSAMGVPRSSALGSLRISFDDRVDPADLDRFADAFKTIARG